MTHTTSLRLFSRLAVARALLLILVALPFIIFVTQASAEDGVVKRDVYDLPTPVAIQGRTNNIDQSFALNVGYIPTDSFNRGYPVSLNYAFYFKPYFAWEVVNYSYNFNTETQLKRDFNDLGLSAQNNVGLGGVLDFPKSIVMTGLVYTPLYGKSLLFNKSLVHSETSFYFGVGALLLNKSGSVPAVAPGIQGRYFLSPKTALRLYLRQYFFKDSKLGITGMTDLGVGYEVQFDLFSRHSSSDDEED